MKKQNYRSLAYAVAIAVSCAAVPGTSWAAEAPAASAQPTSSSTAPAVPEAANVKADAAAAPAEAFPVRTHGVKSPGRLSWSNNILGAVCPPKSATR